VRRASNGDVEELHRRCGIYTKRQVVDRVLDAIGWRSDAPLFEFRFLECAAGDGAFVVEAAQRLVISCRQDQIEVEVATLTDCIRAFELHNREAQRARSNVVRALRKLGVDRSTAIALGGVWIVNRDFLLAELPADGFTHAAGNPPYVRWSKIPFSLRAIYDRQIPREMTGGDLFLPFLDRALEHLRPDGTCGFLCSDRWRYMAFAEAFREKWLPRLDIASEDSLLASEAFVADVGAYPSILIAKRRTIDKVNLRKFAGQSGKTLAELGYVIRVGPALGHTPAYVLRPDERDVEPELLHPWIDGAEVAEGAVQWEGRRVVTMHDDDGKLIDLKRYPRLTARLKRFQRQLKLRSIVRDGAVWFRPIDRLRAADWRRPKLLVPELAKIPRLAIDRTGSIPSHGVYAIFAPNDDVENLYEQLRDGRLARALDGRAPKIKGGYVRCYRSFLAQVSLEG
jgi:adenine-specific DNA-methyltransferase